jgi:hypothetical protein
MAAGDTRRLRGWGHSAQSARGVGGTDRQSSAPCATAQDGLGKCLCCPHPRRVSETMSLRAPRGELSQYTMRLDVLRSIGEALAMGRQSYKRS